MPALSGLGLAIGLMAVAWVASMLRRDASLVDRFWGLAFVALAWWYRDAAPPATAAIWFRDLAVTLVTVWGVRLSFHITRRNWGQGEDFRYRAMRGAGGRHWGWRSLLTVFALQAVLAWVIAMPLLVIMTGMEAPQPILAALGSGCWVVGMVFEAGGDWQLARFRANPSNRGAVLDSGLWRYTRHPNYFGDALCWWGYFLLAAAVGGWWSIFSPVLMTVLLLKVSGVALLEVGLSESKPQYRESIRRTSAFLPWPPRA
jgi:steroid 5-alpha reductase family enzyme